MKMKVMTYEFLTNIVPVLYLGDPGSHLGPEIGYYDRGFS